MNITDKVNRISNNANIINAATPFEENASWDDPEDWFAEAVELAHDIIDLISYFQDGGKIPKDWIPRV